MTLESDDHARQFDRHFGRLTPRPQQTECLERILASTAQVVVVQAPTGSGKSAIMLALARVLRERDAKSTAYVVTPQRTLQDQLVLTGY